MRQVLHCPGQFVRSFRVRAALVAALVLVPFLAIAAPYADYVIDIRTGQVLHEKNADTRLHPASLTKMMTLYVAFEAIERGEISLDSKVTISKHAASEPPSRLGLKAGQTIALRYLIRAAAIKSANDAATAIGEAIEGSEAAFANRMNRTAKALGMTKSTFKNANGLTQAGHLSTAHDMTLLGRHLFYDYPQYYNLFSRTTADAGVAKVASTNRRFLGSYAGADGIKTGYTVAAGFNLVASAQRGNKRLIATVFGGKSTANRNARVAELLDMGFGKAPDRVAVQKPGRPVYADIDNDADDGVAKVVAEAVAGNRTLPAGKTIRLVVAVKTSPRPKGRPGTEAAPVEEMLLALQDDINAALAEASELVPEVVAEAAAADPAPEATPDVADTGDEIEVAGEATAQETAPVFVQSTEPQPETLAVAAAMALEASPKPAAAPNRVESEPIQTAKDEPAEETGTAPAIEVAAVDTDSTEPAAKAPDLAPADEVIVLAEAPEIKPADPDQIVLAEPSAEDVNPEELEVVTRVSTSGGRQWAINVGHFNNRYNAERQLLQTALIEMNTLDEALRKVVARKGGFDANFVGMTEETAQLACRRLQARQSECTVVGP